MLLLKDTSFLTYILALASPETFVQLVIAAFLAILFLQSGLDKVFQWKGNLAWLTGHFAKTFLSGSVPLMLGVITLLEVASGTCCAIGLVEIVFWKTSFFALLGAEIAAAVLVMLFFGQRIAQDYAGAAGLVPYFIVTLISIFLFDIKIN